MKEDEKDVVGFLVSSPILIASELRWRSLFHGGSDQPFRVTLEDSRQSSLCQPERNTLFAFLVARSHEAHTAARWRSHEAHVGARGYALSRIVTHMQSRVSACTRRTLSCVSANRAYAVVRGRALSRTVTHKLSRVSVHTRRTLSRVDACCRAFVNRAYAVAR